MSDYNERLEIAVHLALVQIRATVLKEFDPATLNAAGMQQVQRNDVSALVRLRIAPLMFDGDVEVSRYRYTVPVLREMSRGEPGCYTRSVDDPVQDCEMTGSRVSSLGRPPYREMRAFDYPTMDPARYGHVETVAQDLCEDVLEEVTVGVQTPDGRTSGASVPRLPEVTRKVDWSQDRRASGVWKGAGWVGDPLRPCRLFGTGSGETGQSEVVGMEDESDESDDETSVSSGGDETLGTQDTGPVPVVSVGSADGGIATRGATNSNPVDLTH